MRKCRFPSSISSLADRTRSARRIALLVIVLAGSLTGDVSASSDALAEAAQARATGDWGGAEEAARNALARARADDDAAGIAAARGTVALLVARRDPVEGERLLEEALSEARDAGESEIAAALLVDIGSLRAAQGRFPDAAARFDEAHEAAVNANAPAVAAQALANAARAWLDAGESDRARERLEQGLLESAKLPEDASRALVQVNLGRVAERLIEDGHGERTAFLRHAHAAYSSALVAAHADSDSRTTSFALGRLAVVYAQDGRRGDAIGLVRRALARSETGNHPELSWRWRALLGTWLAEKGDREKAIRELSAAVDGAETMRTRGVQAEELGAAYLVLADLLLARAGGREDADARNADLRLAQDTLERLKAAELRDYFQDECVEAYEARNRDPSQVSPKALVIYPVLLPDRLVLLVSGPGFIRQQVVDVPGERVAEEARALRRKVVKRVTREFEPHARQLHAWLIEPAADAIVESAAETLVFVPSGPLLATPFSALRDDDGFLVESYAIAVIPSLELTDPQPIAGRELRVLIGGLSESVQGYAELPSVSQEANRIHDMYPGSVLLDSQFSSTQIESEIEGKQFDVVHLASHAQFGARTEETFVLTWDDRISMNELSRLIGRLRYRDRPLELLTLSACETASGDERAALGLVGVAVKAGARSALGTLWSVDDQAAAQIVENFYARLREPGTSRAEALRRAQLAMLEDPRFDHPGYWSAFLLVSNWL